MKKIGRIGINKRHKLLIEEENKKNTKKTKDYKGIINIVKQGKPFDSQVIIKRPARDACLCMGELPAPPAPHFVFLITL